MGRGEAKLLELIKHIISEKYYKYPDPNPSLKYSKAKYCSPYLSGVIKIDPTKRYYLNLETYIGCPYKCYFCTWGGTKIEKRPIETIVEEINLMFSNSSVYGGFFCDADFFLYKSRALHALNAIRKIKHNAKIYIESTPFSVDDEIIALLKDLKYITLSFGMQSTNTNVLLKSNRKDDIKAFNDSYRMLKSKSPFTLVNIGIIYGLPYDTLSSYITTLNHALALNPDSLTISKFELLPGSHFFKYRNELGIMNSEFPMYEVVRTKSFSEEDFKYAQELSMIVRMIYNFPFVKSFIHKIGHKLISMHKAQIAYVYIYNALYNKIQQDNGLKREIPKPICKGVEDNIARAEYFQIFVQSRYYVKIIEWIDEIIKEANMSIDDNDIVFNNDYRMLIDFKNILNSLSNDCDITSDELYNEMPVLAKYKALKPCGRKYF